LLEGLVMEIKKTAVLLMNLGGPDSLDAVETFLFNLFSDKQIIKLPLSFLLQKFIARKIASSRAKKVIPRYKAIGGSSPINEITRAQAAALQKRLNEEYGGDIFLVEPVMRYWKPYTADVIGRLIEGGYTNIIALTLYPHYSAATTGSSINELERVLKKTATTFTVKYVTGFATHEGYVKALCSRIKNGLGKFPDPEAVHVLFSAHSLPEDFIKKGDPYCTEVQNTIKEILKMMEIKKHHLAFQSRSGPVKWLEPATDKTIERLAKEGVKDMLIVPISFVSDHVETLYEIDIMFKELAKVSGIQNFIRAESFNDSKDFIDVLKDLVIQKLHEKGESQ
jgi:ferrochelatase